MYQAKVSNTEKYSDSQGEHVVCKGKLILINDEDWHTVYSNEQLKARRKRENLPIIISETEDIEEGDWVYDALENPKWQLDQVEELIPSKDIFYCKKGGCAELIRGWNKVLALSEHFSDKHLQAIVDGKMEDGDEVLVECERKHPKEGLAPIYLDHQNHITLFPAKQSLEEAFEDWWNSDFEFTAMGDPEACYMETFKAGAEWAKKNNY